MKRGTTPTHIYTLPLEVNTLSSVSITYRQAGGTILTKKGEDLSMNGITIRVKLTQEETLSFSCAQPVEIQVRALTAGGDALASKIMRVSVERCLDGEVLV
jgi:hypothetical protein